MTDNSTANGWRLAMLGQIDPSAFREMTAEFPSDTTVLLIDSTRSEFEAATESDWYDLIGEDWTVVEIGQ